jgi:hypothetical protein
LVSSWCALARTGNRLLRFEVAKRVTNSRGVSQRVFKACGIRRQTVPKGICEMMTAGATLSTRYSFTAQFLRGGAIFARRAHDIEKSANSSISDELHAEHVACVVGAITQSAAALEAEISEVAIHGPGHHLGSDGIDANAREFLVPMADVIDNEPTLRRYDLVLHLLRRPPFNHGEQPYQDADLLVRLRNGLIHYKSKWGEQMDREKLFSRLQQLRFDKPTFLSPHTNFFPHRCFSASLASWSVTTGVELINVFYRSLAVASPLSTHSAYLTVPAPRREGKD